MKWTNDLGQKLLALLPENVKAVAADANGQAFASCGIPKLGGVMWLGGEYTRFIGRYNLDGQDWRKTLITRPPRPATEEHVGQMVWVRNNNVSGGWYYRKLLLMCPMHDYPFVCETPSKMHIRSWTEAVIDKPVDA